MEQGFEGTDVHSDLNRIVDALPGLVWTALPDGDIDFLNSLQGRAPRLNRYLNEAAREVITLSWGELQRSRVILREELAEDLPPVAGDRVQLQQVILNLLRNAAEAMSGVSDRPRQLVIRTERDEGDAERLTVQDAGVGFEPQGVDKLFQPFYTTKNEGMGIGLSVSRSIIENHNGRLWAEPNDGPGATFSFSIPRRPEQPLRDS
jgi:signal transduction histidine kinase